jgi:hypothetical protein
MAKNGVSRPSALPQNWHFFGLFWLAGLPVGKRSPLGTAQDYWLNDSGLFRRITHTPNKENFAGACLLDQENEGVVSPEDGRFRRGFGLNT